MKTIDLSRIEFRYNGLMAYRRALSELGGNRAAVEQRRQGLVNAPRMAPTEDDFPNFTIGITAFNRPHYLTRCLDYILDYFPGSTVIVADSSTDENKALHKAKIDSLANNDRGVRLHVEPFAEDAPQLETVLYLAERAETEFFVKWDDDDFYNPSAVREALGMMDADRSVVTMAGPSINMAVPDAERIIVTGHAVVPSRDRDIIQRLTFLALTATQCWNNLFRTRVFRDGVASIMYLRSTELDQLWDQAMSIEVALRGNWDRTSQLLMARRSGQGRITENLNFRGRALIYKLIDPEKSEDYVKFHENIRKSLTRTFGTGREQFVQVALEEVCKSVFMASCINEPLFRTVYRDFISTHPENESWRDIIARDKSAQTFVSTAMAIVDETA
jgi:glycosyltransferase domain-containing protein